MQGDIVALICCPKIGNGLAVIEVSVLPRETMRLFGDWANDLHRVFYNNLEIMQPAIHCLQWSFGVTYWEVFSLGRTPYPGVDPFTLIKFLNNGGRLDRPANAACSQKM